METPHPRAWLLGFIVPGDPPKLASVKIYSERHPTGMKGIWTELLVGHGKSFQEGIDDIKRQVKGAYPWMEPYIGGGRLDEVPLEVPEAVGDSDVGWEGWPLGEPGTSSSEV